MESAYGDTNRILEHEVQTLRQELKAQRELSDMEQKTAVTMLKDKHSSAVRDSEREMQSKMQDLAMETDAMLRKQERDAALTLEREKLAVATQCREFAAQLQERDKQYQEKLQHEIEELKQQMAEASTRTADEVCNHHTSSPLTPTLTHHSTSSLRPGKPSSATTSKNSSAPRTRPTSPSCAPSRWRTHACTWRWRSASTRQARSTTNTSLAWTQRTAESTTLLRYGCRSSWHSTNSRYSALLLLPYIFFCTAFDGNRTYLIMSKISLIQPTSG